MILIRRKSYYIVGAILGIAMFASACSKTAGQGEESPDELILYEGISDPAILLFTKNRAYSGFPPVDASLPEFKKTFFPIVRVADQRGGGQCLFPSPPLDDDPSTIAIGVPSQRDFVGQFECGKFRFEVEGCEGFSTNCSSKLIRAFRIENDKLVNSYFWDQCRGVYMYSNVDLREGGNWVHAFVPSGDKRLFEDRTDSCLEL